jgi:hypothetical protein
MLNFASRSTDGGDMRKPMNYRDIPTRTLERIPVSEKPSLAPDDQTEPGPSDPTPAQSTGVDARDQTVKAQAD